MPVSVNADKKEKRGSNGYLNAIKPVKENQIDKSGYFKYLNIIILAQVPDEKINPSKELTASFI